MSGQRVNDAGQACPRAWLVISDGGDTHCGTCGANPMRRQPQVRDCRAPAVDDTETGEAAA